ncbi:hypothetical protein LCGC14_1584370 [marine sediment metagenome]|uniref:Uncharacterized protein n=1 Tax=marine sediment metagenome TaxID=412755 RepID=A0A0F9J200_9ZZZZ
MNNETSNLPTINYSKEAFELIKSHEANQDLIFVAPEDLRTQSMFLPEVVVIKSTIDDYHDLKTGQFMPKGHQTDRIGEAAGIAFLDKNCGTRTELVDGNTAYVGFAQAKKRMPDGTWRTSSICEYEFNPVLRAEEDILRDKGDKYKDENKRKLLTLTYKKFGRARAGTGARLRVIRELTGMQTSFKRDQLQKSMVFCRIAVNTDLLLADPKTREVALEAALGVTRQIYGPPKEGPKALSDHYTVEDDNHGQAPPPENNTQKHGGQTTDDIWGKTGETDEQKKTREMADDLRKRRMEYSKELSEKALIEIDTALSEPINPHLINVAIENLDAWEVWRTEQRGGK